jgi:hypothetical protein
MPLGEGSFATMLSAKNVTFTKTHTRFTSAPEWEQYVLEQDVKIVYRKEVSRKLLGRPCLHLPCLQGVQWCALCDRRDGEAGVNDEDHAMTAVDVR